MPEAYKLSFADLPTDSPMAGLVRRRIIGEHAMISEVRVEAGFVLEPHSHANEQMAVVLSGRCVFQLPRADGGVREVECRAGDVLVIPPHAPHGVRMLEATHILDIFSPPSQKTGIDRS